MADQLEGSVPTLKCIFMHRQLALHTRTCKQHPSLRKGLAQQTCQLHIEVKVL